MIGHRRRRHLLGTAVLTAAAAQLGMLASADAQSAKATLPLIKPGANISFGPLEGKPTSTFADKALPGD